MKENEKEIFIDEMADLGDEWTIEELKGTSYEKMSLEGYKRKKISSWENGWDNRHHYFLININF